MKLKIRIPEFFLFLIYSCEIQIIERKIVKRYLIELNTKKKQEIN